MDIVVGDFGRPGTLRYLEAFSERERELIVSRLPPGEPFYDEHRQVQLTVLCQLPRIKRQLLEPYLRQRRPFDDGVLVGSANGAPIETVVPELASLLADHILLAHGQGARRVRVVIPCNTWGRATGILERALGERLPEHAEVEVAQMQRFVTRGLAGRGPRSVLVLGTPNSVEAYAEALGKADPPVMVPDNPPELTTAYERCISDVVAGDLPDGNALEVVRTRAAAHRGEGREVLEACTDLSLGVGLDALEIYAAQLVLDAYGE
jgi:aspartate/glutamate racemase